jgi:hypothetical protein
MSWIPSEKIRKQLDGLGKTLRKRYPVDSSVQYTELKKAAIEYAEGRAECGLFRAMFTALTAGPNSRNHPGKEASQKARYCVMTAYTATDERSICPCGNFMGHKANFRKGTLVFPSGCCLQCALRSERRRERTVATCLARYGVASPRQLQSVKDKQKETTLRRYGVDNISKLQEAKDKKVATLMKNYGVTNPSLSAPLQEKKIATFMERFGVRNPLQNAEVKAKSEATCLARYGVKSTGGHVPRLQKLSDTWERKSKREIQAIVTRREQTYMTRYGVRCAMHVPDIVHKTLSSSYHTHKNVRVDGRSFTVQGAEGIFLQYASQYLHLSVNNVRTADRVPTFKYEVGGKVHVYYPDFIVGRKHIVEVKSTYTAGLTKAKKARDRLRKKIAAVQNSGYRMSVFVMIGKHKSVLITRADYTKQELARAVAAVKKMAFGSCLQV